MAERDTLEEEVGFTDCCPWLETEETDRRVVITEKVEQGEELTVVEEVEYEEEEWLVVDEVNEEDGDEVEEWLVVDVFEEDIDEEDADDGEEEEGMRRKRIRRMKCPVCGELCRHQARHALAHHLPWFWAPLTSCQDCTEQFVNVKALQYHRAKEHQGNQEVWSSPRLNSFIRGLLEMLLSLIGLGSFEQLLQTLNSDKLLQRICSKKTLTNSDLELCRAVDTSAPFIHTDSYSIFDSFGNFTIFSLLHWRVILHLLTKLSASQQNLIRNYALSASSCISVESGEIQQQRSSSPEIEVVEFSPFPDIQLSSFPEELGSSYSQSPPSDFPNPECTSAVEFSAPSQIADSHFHLDHLLTSVGIHDLQEFDHRNIGNSFNTELSIVISNYCFPKLWPKREDRNQLAKQIPELHFSFGIHPKTVQTTREEILEEYLDTLEEIIKTEKTVSIGECGLDTSNTSKFLHLDRQITFLEKQLELAVHKHLPVVIHCRGNIALHFQLLDSLVKICPSSHPLHWHCFSGIQTIYDQMKSKFSNIVFGITPFIFSRSHLETFVRNNSITDLVLETDSPFIFHQNQPSNPFIVNFVAKHISQTLDISFHEVVKVTTENVRRIYQL